MLTCVGGWQVISPDGHAVYTAQEEPGGSFDFYATVEGMHSFCFVNREGPMKTVTTKIGVGEPPDLIEVSSA